MLHRCSAIGFLTNFKIFKGILFIPVALLLSKFGIIVQGDIKNDSHG